MMSNNLSGQNQHLLQAVQPCCCSGLLQLTSQTDFPSLDACLKQLATRLAPESKVELIRFGPDRPASDIPGITRFKLATQKREIGLLILDGELDSHTHNQIKLLCDVFVNQCRMIALINHDRLTSLGNRQALDTKLNELFDSNRPADRRSKESTLYLALMDIDRFKQINDQFGHLYGDEILLQFSQLMTKTFRTVDHLYRYGGEEFLVILSDVNLKQAESVLQRFRSTVENFTFPLVDQVTVSIGLTELKLDNEAISNIDNADRALYFAKKHGRNQLQIYESLIASGRLKVKRSLTDDITLYT